MASGWKPVDSCPPAALVLLTPLKSMQKRTSRFPPKGTLVAFTSGEFLDKSTTGADKVATPEDEEDSAAPLPSLVGSNLGWTAFGYTSALATTLALAMTGGSEFLGLDGCNFGFAFGGSETAVSTLTLKSLTGRVLQGGMASVFATTGSTTSTTLFPILPQMVNRYHCEGFPNHREAEPLEHWNHYQP